MQKLLNVIIFLIQFAGFSFVGAGLNAIWPPLAMIYAGALLIFLGGAMYRDMKSEEPET